MQTVIPSPPTPPNLSCQAAGAGVSSQAFAGSWASTAEGARTQNLSEVPEQMLEFPSWSWGGGGGWGGGVGAHPYPAGAPGQPSN